MIFLFINLRIDSLSKGTIDLLFCPSVLHGVLYGAIVLESRKFDVNSVEDGSKSSLCVEYSSGLCAINFLRSTGSIVSEGTMNLFRGEIQKLTFLTKNKECLFTWGATSRT